MVDISKSLWSLYLKHYLHTEPKCLQQLKDTDQNLTMDQGLARFLGYKDEQGMIHSHTDHFSIL